MKKKILVKKGVVVAVILLFIGIAFVPSIGANISKASIDSEMVEITTEVCGINGVTPNTVLLSKEEAEEVEKLFDSIKERLDKAETREDAVEIFKEAVVELDKYGLLGGLSVKQAKRLVTGNSRNPVVQKIIDRIFDRFLGNSNDYDNARCLIFGTVTNALYFDYWVGLYFINWAKEHGYNWIPGWAAFCTLQRVPTKRATFISLGYYYSSSYPSQGIVWTMGKEGTKEWNGSLCGGFFEFTIPYLSVHPVGVKCFRGFSFQFDGKTRFLGFAHEVKIDYW